MGITKAVSDRFGKGGIADRMIWFNGFPFLDNKEDHTFGVPVSQVMQSELRTLSAAGLEVHEVENVLASNHFNGFPIVEDASSNILVGYIGRTELRYALDRARRDQMVPTHAKCFFTPQSHRGIMPITPSTPNPAVTFDSIAETSGQMSVDLSKFVDSTPLAVHPRLPLETVMELFKKLGPRVILVEHRGRLTGLVTVKDCLKYQFQVEAHENPKDDSALREGQDRLWHVMKRVGSWVNERFVSVRHGAIQLRSPAVAHAGGADSPTSADREERRREGNTLSREASPSNTSAGGLAVDGLGLELEDRWSR